jgi:ribosomal protein S18 acetylase RimI-like enzyme
VCGVGLLVLERADPVTGMVTGTCGHRAFAGYVAELLHLEQRADWLTDRVKVQEAPPAVTVQVRRARAEEADDTARLVERSYVGEGFIDSDNPYVEELRAGADRFVEAELFVAVADGGAVVGTVTYCAAGTAWAEIARAGEAEFRMLAVAPSRRGSGVGSALVVACVDRAVAAGAERLVMSTTQEMTTAHRLYERLGFSRRPERDWAPRPGLLLWVYGLDLLP